MDESLVAIACGIYDGSLMMNWSTESLCHGPDGWRRNVMELPPSDRQWDRTGIAKDSMRRRTRAILSSVPRNSEHSLPALSSMALARNEEQALLSRPQWNYGSLEIAESNHWTDERMIIINEKYLQVKRLMANEICILSVPLADAIINCVIVWRALIGLTVYYSHSSSFIMAWPMSNVELTCA